MTCQEMKRRSPLLRLNAGNSTVDQLMDTLAVLEDKRDTRYVIDKEKEHREMFQRLSAQIGANDQGGGQAACMRPEDRMWFALSFLRKMCTSFI